MCNHWDEMILFLAGLYIVLCRYLKQASAALHVAFLQDVGNVELNCPLGDAQSISNLFVRKSFCNKNDNLLLAQAEYAP